MKRLLIFILICSFLLAFTGCSDTHKYNTDTNTDSGIVFPDNDTETKKYSEGLSFSKRSDGTYCLDGIGTCNDRDIVIPSVYQNQQVKEIAENAFAFTENIVSVVIPESIISINPNAFYLCENLERVTFEDKKGWIAKELDTLVTGIELSVDDETEAATLLIDTYSDYFWRKK